MRRLAVCLLVLACACSQQAPMSGQARTVGPVTMSLRVEPDRVRAGSQARFTLSLHNDSGRAVELVFPDGQRYDFVVSRRDREVWRWSDERVFTQAVVRTELAGQSGVQYSESWRSAEPGTYAVTAVLKARGFAEPLRGTVTVQ